jgi:hypothetical protein
VPGKAGPPVGNLNRSARPLFPSARAGKYFYRGRLLDRPPHRAIDSCTRSGPKTSNDFTNLVVARVSERRYPDSNRITAWHTACLPAPSSGSRTIPACFERGGASNPGATVPWDLGTIAGATRAEAASPVERKVSRFSTAFRSPERRGSEWVTAYEMQQFVGRLGERWSRPDIGQVAAERRRFTHERNGVGGYCLPCAGGRPGARGRRTDRGLDSQQPDLLVRQ